MVYRDRHGVPYHCWRPCLGRKEGPLIHPWATDILSWAISVALVVLALGIVILVAMLLGAMIGALVNAMRKHPAKETPQEKDSRLTREIELATLERKLRKK